MEKIYLSPASSATAEFVEKRSRFIANIAHIDSEEEALGFIRSIKKKYYDAKHSAYAYITSGIKRYSDDGEPAKTAGFPILEMLDAQNLTDCVCVVTRYFGGVLLGTGGLVRAYTAAAKLSLEEAGIKRMSLHSKFIFTVPYSIFDSVKYVAGEVGCEFLNCDYTDVVSVEAVCKEDLSKNLIDSLTGTFGTNIKYEFVENLYR